MSQLSISAQLGALHNQFQNEVSVFEQEVSTQQLSLSGMKTSMVVLRGLYSSMEALVENQKKYSTLPHSFWKNYPTKILQVCEQQIATVQNEITKKEARMCRSGLALPPLQVNAHPDFPLICGQECNEDDGGPPEASSIERNNPLLLLDSFVRIYLLFSFVSYRDLCEAAPTSRTWRQMYHSRGQALYTRYWEEISKAGLDPATLSAQYCLPLLPMPTPNRLVAPTDFVQMMSVMGTRPVDSYEIRTQLVSLLPEEVHQFHRDICGSMRSSQVEEVSIGPPPFQGKNLLCELPHAVAIQTLASYLPLKELCRTACSGRTYQQLCQSTAEYIYPQLARVIDCFDQKILEHFPRCGKSLLSQLGHVLGQDTPTPLRLLKIQKIMRGKVAVMILSLYDTHGRSRQKKQFDVFSKEISVCPSRDPLFLPLIRENIQEPIQSAMSAGMGIHGLRPDSPSFVRRLIKMGYFEEAVDMLERGDIDSLPGMVPRHVRYLSQVVQIKTLRKLYDLQDNGCPRKIREGITQGLFSRLVQLGDIAALLDMLEEELQNNGHKYIKVGSPNFTRFIITAMQFDYEKVSRLDKETGGRLLSDRISNQVLDIHLSMGEETWKDLALIGDICFIKTLLDLADKGQMQQAQRMLTTRVERDALHQRLRMVEKERRYMGQSAQAHMVSKLIDKAVGLSLFMHKPELSSDSDSDESNFMCNPELSSDSDSDESKDEG